MAVFKNSSPIVSNGLVLNLDAASYKSYPTTGNTVYDLSGFENNFSLNNGVLFNTTNYYFMLDGTDDRIQINSSSSLTLGTSDFTLDIWVYPKSLSTYNHLFVLGNATNGDGTGFSLKCGRAGDGDGLVYLYAGAGAYTTYGTVNNTIISINQWNNITMTNSSGVVSLYRNGFIGGSKPGLSINFGNLKWTIGNSPSSEMLSKDVAVAKIYNRSLSLGEIQQNFNTLRGRFGL